LRIENSFARLKVIVYMTRNLIGDSSRSSVNKQHIAVRVAELSASAHFSHSFVVILGLSLYLLSSALPAPAQVQWDMKQLSVPPHIYPADNLHEDGVRALFYDGVSWQGKPTRVFAWYGVPAHPAPGKLPAMVLVHGGGGTAFANWVRLWNDRGYAAIAMDTCGSIPVPAAKGWQRSDDGGPPCWDASFDQLDWPEKDQWTYQAVADVMLANSLLRSFPEIDPNRIGLTGISWGGYLTSIIGSVDSRFRFAAPVYGCGYLGEDSHWVPSFTKMGPEKANKWLGLWDPSVFLGQATIPYLWIDGTNDEFYPFDSLQKSYQLTQGEKTFSFHVRMIHSHEAGEPPEEIHAFADHFLNSGPTLAAIGPPKRKGQLVWIDYKAKLPIDKAVLNYTTDSGAWRPRHWDAIPAELKGKHNAQATLPAAVTAYYLDLVDAHGLIVSSDLQIPANSPH
jgi:dienelactone hydrolase